MYGHSMLGFCSRLSTASLNHPPFTFYNARGLRIVKCPLRMKRTSSFVCDCVLEEQSLSVLSLSAKTRHSVLVDVRRMRRVFVRMCFIDVDYVFDSLYSGNRFCVRFAMQRQSIYLCVRFALLRQSIHSVCFRFALLRQSIMFECFIDSDCHGQHVLLRKLRQARSCEIWWRREVFGWRSRRIGDAARQSL